MTRNQIAYAVHLEQQTANRNAERETNRHNVAVEQWNTNTLLESIRSNKERERQGLLVLGETTRHNKATEKETARHNKKQESNTIRAAQIGAGAAIQSASIGAAASKYMANASRDAATTVAQINQNTAMWDQLTKKQIAQMNNASAEKRTSSTNKTNTTNTVITAGAGVIGSVLGKFIGGKK